MTTAPAKYAHYLADFQSLTEGPGAEAPAWLKSARDNAWTKFAATGFPTARRGNERWKYTNVGPIARTDFGYPLAPAPADGSEGLVPSYQVSGQTVFDLIYVDGVYSPGLSSPALDASGVVAASLAVAAGNDSLDLEGQVGRYAPPDDDGFAALNTAFLRDGAYVNVADDHAEKVVIRISYITSQSEDANHKVTYPRTMIVAGRNTDITVVESYRGPQESVYFTNAVTEISVREGAKLDHYRLLLEGGKAFHVGTSRVIQEKDSSFSSASFALGTTLARNDLEVLLDAPGAYCSLNGLYLTADNQHIDNLISIDHAKPNCTSRLNYKGILDGKSRAVFGGTVMVRRDAQKSDAEQTDKNLILSNSAEVDSKPSLLIYADDVKCSHGATAGHIDADTLFYLRSRGLDLDTASRMLVHAFASEIINTVNLEPLQDYLNTLFAAAIPNKALPIAGLVPSRRAKAAGDK
ncbi:MAG: Fe-S cluster assembly protein SufD [Chloroflexi bacterium]|nr:Fe-S cluster assembly protein SufD [Chloroflexota bacterium]MDA1270212.1 Fe-S cluster assembly protein SufD [Chloroflexota bacterium]PKB59779.1 MAG: Fe-S cluster assembly protein SufD [SAR202 cluster bacterium Casp-Chloro-G2]